MSRDIHEQLYRALEGQERHLTRRAVGTSFKEVQEALEWSEQHYRALFETMTQGVIYQDSMQRVLTANPAAQRILGLTLDQMQGRTSFDPEWRIVDEHGSTLPDDMLPASVALRTGEAVTNITLGIMLPGQQDYRWISVNVVPQFHPGRGVPFQVYTIFDDITEQKRLRDALYESEWHARERMNELRTIFEALSDNVSVYDKDGRLLHANFSAREMLAIERLPEYDTLPVNERLSLFSLRDEQGQLLAEEQWPIKRILRGEVIKGADAVDVMVHTLDGHEAELSVSGSPTLDEQGNVTGAVVISRNVSGRRALERRTRNALSALLAMAEALVHEIPTLSSEGPERESMVGRRLAELPCRLLGCQRVGIAVLDIEAEALHPMVVVGMSPEHERQWRNIIEGARLPSLLGDMEFVSRLRAGELLLLDKTHTFFRDLPSHRLIAPIVTGEQLIGILSLGYGNSQPHHTGDELALIRGISRLAALVIEREKAQIERDRARVALQEANEQLEQMNKIKSDFVSIVSHEFRTALTTIQGFSEMMRDQDFSIAEMKEFAVDIYSDANRLTRLVNEMLDLERMEVGGMKLNIDWLDLNAIIMEVVGHARPAMEQHTIRLQLASALPILMGDRDKLTQVVANLLNNAIKYSPNGGEICISSQVEGSVVHVSVRDSGIGIAAEAIDRIFERYARVESGTSIPGTGLGLPIVRQIVQMHGGQVWAESILGEGSLFHFTIPFTNVSLKASGLLS